MGELMNHLEAKLKGWMSYKLASGARSVFGQV
jgi:hypothetical protein